MKSKVQVVKGLSDAIPLGPHPFPHDEFILVRLDFVQHAIKHLSDCRQIVTNLACAYMIDEEVIDNNYDFLYNHFLDNGEMPYTVAKGRDADPHQWLSDKLQSLAMSAAKTEAQN